MPYQDSCPPANSALSPQNINKKFEILVEKIVSLEQKISKWSQILGKKSNFVSLIRQPSVASLA